MQRNKNKKSIFSAVSRGKARWAKGGKLGKMGEKQEEFTRELQNQLLQKDTHLCTATKSLQTSPVV